MKHAAEHCERPDVTWMERIEIVAAYWEVPGDEVRTLYVVELYSNGLDELGSEAYKTVTDKQPLLCRLLTLAGQRLAALTSNVQSQTSFARNFSTMSPTLGAWVRSMVNLNHLLDFFFVIAILRFFHFVGRECVGEFGN